MTSAQLHWVRSRRFWAFFASFGALVAALATFATNLVSIQESVCKLFACATPVVEQVLGEQIDFRPRQNPPANPALPGAATDWILSPVVVTATVGYIHRTPGLSGAQVLRETLTAASGATSRQYDWAYLVNITSDVPCEDWLCRRKENPNVGPENIEPGKASPARQTMFVPAPTDAISWKDFIDPVMSAQRPQFIQVSLRSLVAVGASNQTLDRSCRIDVEKYRSDFAKFSGTNLRPVFWAPKCEQTSVGSK